MIEEGFTGSIRSTRFTISSWLTAAGLGFALALGGCTGATQSVHKPEEPLPPVTRQEPAPSAPVATPSAEAAAESTPVVPDVAPARLPSEPVRHEYSIPFSSGSAELGPRARAMLDDLARWVEGAAGFCELEIRTAARGGESTVAQRDLARRRGESVRAYLLQQAPIRPERIRVFASDEGAVRTASSSRKPQAVMVAVLPH